MLNLFRRVYNLSVAGFRDGAPPSSEFRAEVCQTAKAECWEADVLYSANCADAAFRKAVAARSAVIQQNKKRRGKKPAKQNFLSRNNAKQYFVEPRLGRGGVFPRLLGGCHWAEAISESAFGKTAIITYCNGKWFACVQAITRINQPVVGNAKTIALDPGVRTFQTGFSATEAIKFGDKFAESKLVPLMLNLDRLLSIRSLLGNEDQELQWVQNRLKENKRRINKLRSRQMNLVEDLHKRIAFDLVNNYDVILLPSFKTKDLVKKSSETRTRFLARKSVRSMLGLAHYKFKLILNWFAKKFGKQVIEANESYSTKTMWDGSINESVGGKTSISFGGISVDRDVHGARNIFIRFLTKAAEDMSPPAAHAVNITRTEVGGSGVLE